MKHYKMYIGQKNSEVITANLKYDNEEEFKNFQSAVQDGISSKNSMWVFDSKNKKHILLNFAEVATISIYEN